MSPSLEIFDSNKTNSYNASSQAAPPRCSLLLVESRRATFTDSVLKRADVETVLLRFDTVALSNEYRARTAAVPTFTLNTKAPLENEAARYREWTADIGITTQFFCNPNEALQESAQRFAALVGLPHLSEQQVRMVHDKTTMKQRYTELGIPHPLYRRVKTCDEVLDFATTASWPLILKPIDSDSCIDTYRLESPSDVFEIELRSEHEWMVEEFIRGTEYQLCSIVADGKVLDAYLSLNPRPVLEVLEGAINANITFAPDEELPLNPRALAQRLADGLDLSYGYLHGEFFITEDDRFVMSEVAGRLSGCEVPMNHALAYGFDFLGAVLDTYIGRVPELNYTCNRAVGDLLLPVTPGHVVRVSAVEELLSLPGVIDAHINVRPGEFLNPLRASFSSSGYVHVEGTSAAEVERRMHNILDHYMLEIE